MKQLIIFSIVVLSVMAATQVAGQPARTIAVIGEARALVDPDFAQWKLNVVVYDDDLREAKKLSDEKLQGFVDMGAALGLEKDDIEIGKALIDKVYERDDRGNQKKFRHYRFSRSMVILERDLDQFEEFLDALVLQSDIIAETTYGVSNIESLTDDLRLEALRNAKIKATSLASELGAEIGNPLQVSEYKPAGSRQDIDDVLAKQSGFVRRFSVPEKKKVTVRMYATFELK